MVVIGAGTLLSYLRPLLGPSQREYGGVVLSLSLSHTHTHTHRERERERERECTAYSKVSPSIDEDGLGQLASI